MDFLTQIFTENTTQTWILEILFILFWTFFLSLFIGFIYKKTYKWHYYNQNFVQTIIILSVLIAMVMQSVGSSASWAFALMWVLSIIRFKNSLKDTRDLGFIFFWIAVWLAMWMKLYILAFVWTLALSFIFFIIDKFSLFSWELTTTKILKVQVLEDVDFTNLFENIFKKYLKFSELISIVPVFETKIIEKNSITKKVDEIVWTEVSENETIVVKNNEISYKIIYKNDLDLRNFLQEIEKISGNNKTSIL